jgi:hypothetical protein
MELANLIRIYRDEDKFKGTGENFEFKVMIFHDKCNVAGVPQYAYMHVGEDVWEWQHEVDYYGRTAHL